MKKEYKFDARIWLYPGKAGWCFVTLPLDVAEDIDYYFADNKRGWGSLPVQVEVGDTKWKTSIFPDKKSKSYLLPVKAEVRKKEGLKVDQLVMMSVELG